jgi:hypothetical protein
MKCWDKDYLVTVDHYSNFWETDYVENTLSSTIINKLRSHFSRHGIPDIVFSDNGPQFDSFFLLFLFVSTTVDMFHISVWNPSLVNSSLANKDFHVLYVNSLLLLFEGSNSKRLAEQEIRCSAVCNDILWCSRWTHCTKWFDIQRRKSCNSDIFEINSCICSSLSVCCWISEVLCSYIGRSLSMFTPSVSDSLLLGIKSFK